MQIACPQCSMRYDLDPRLLPPTGASVQCTRCSFVFTATPSGQVLLPGQPSSPAAPKATGGVPPSVLNSTLLFGAPPARPAAPASPAPPEDVTPVYGTSVQAGAEEGEKTPAFGTAHPPQAAAAALNKTQTFGGPPARPTAETTQAFGAASIPRTPPSPSTTQAFGAASIPRTPPSPSTTQAFGAASIPQAPSPSTTQAFGAASIPQAPSPRATQAFGVAQIRSAEKAAGSASGVKEADKVLPPGLREKKSTADVPWSTPEGSGELRPSLPPEPAGSWGGPPAPPPPHRSAALELPPELLVPSRPAGGGAPREAVDAGGGRERLLIAVAAAVVLGLTAWLTYPAWRNRASELPSEAVSIKDEAVLLLRRDDPASLSQATERLRELVGRYPKYTEAQAELVAVLALRLDDAKAELEWLGNEETRLRQVLFAMEKEKSRPDWSSRVNAQRGELDGLRKQRAPLEASVVQLTQQLEAAFAVIRKAPETEPASDVLARLKAQALQGGVMGTPLGLSMAERFRKVENPPHWSAVAIAEHGLNARVPLEALAKASDELTRVRGRDSTFLRVYVLEARISLREGDPSAARALLDSVVALNPNHTLARKLRGWAASAQESAPPAP
ncbi:zinc-ribbon domain-containing protein [Stigmatella aurantiaca]|nr:zinc-ribbon domain-containing protein [Stigmatella aurantiaca]